MNGLKVKAATHFVIVFAFLNQQILLLGPPLPEPLCGHQMLSWDTNLVVLGGRSSYTSWSSSLYHLECKDGVFTWKTMETTIAKAKSGFVALQVPDDFFTSMKKKPSGMTSNFRGAVKMFLDFSLLVLKEVYFT